VRKVQRRAGASSLAETGDFILRKEWVVSQVKTPQSRKKNKRKVYEGRRKLGKLS